MIVRNEERFLEDCLRSVEGVVDEICLVDTGSTDRTQEIAWLAGARIDEVAWTDDFSAARNASLQMARYRWILVLDADERLTPESAPLVRAIGSSPPGAARWLRCFNFSSGGVEAHYVLRLFPNDPRIRYAGAIHECPTYDGEETKMIVERSEIGIVHLGYTVDAMLARKKHERNAEIARLALKDRFSDPKAWYDFARAQILVENWQPAAMGFEQMQNVVDWKGTLPGYLPNALQLQARVYLYGLGQLDRALGCARQGVEIAGKRPDMHYVLGPVLGAQKREAEARAAWMRAIECAPHAELYPYSDLEIPAWKAQLEIGASCVRTGQLDLALAWFDAALAARPDLEPLKANRDAVREALDAAKKQAVA